MSICFKLYHSSPPPQILCGKSSFRISKFFFYLLLRYPGIYKFRFRDKFLLFCKNFILFFHELRQRIIMLDCIKLSYFLKSKWIKRVAGIILAFFLLSSTSKAQCPGATLDGYTTGNPTLCGGTVPGWTGPITQTLQ